MWNINFYKCVLYFVETMVLGYYALLVWLSKAGNTDEFLISFVDVMHYLVVNICALPQYLKPTLEHNPYIGQNIGFTSCNWWFCDVLALSFIDCI